METINNLNAIPRQTLKTTIGEYEYTIRLFEISTGKMCYDMSIDSNEVITGGRIVYGQLLIPYPRLEADGNFILDIPSGDEPDYTEFNSTQFLRYLTQDETDQWREAWNNGSVS